MLLPTSLHLFHIVRYPYWHSHWVTINYFSFCRMVLEKNENYRMAQIWRVLRKAKWYFVHSCTKATKTTIWLFPILQSDLWLSCQDVRSRLWDRQFGPRDQRWKAVWQLHLPEGHWPIEIADRCIEFCWQLSSFGFLDCFYSLAFVISGAGRVKFSVFLPFKMQIDSFTNFPFSRMGTRIVNEPTTFIASWDDRQ
jgi:hypothetical protein